MDAFEAILTRRSVSRVSKERPDASIVRRLLEAGVRAPNHHMTEPWRFIVLTGKALTELGEAMAGRIRESYVGEPDLEKRIEVEKARPFRAPVILVVIYSPSDNPKAIEVEDRYAVGALMQNILLAAHASGLGAYLRTGPAAEYPGVHDYIRMSSGEEIAGFIYLGYPEQEPSVELSSRTPVDERTEWRGWG
jgi:nitroreductase